MVERLRGDNVLLQMFRTAEAVRELMHGAVAGSGITANEYAVLGAIASVRSVSPTELAALLRVPPTSISRHAARLVDAGLAVRSRGGRRDRDGARRGRGGRARPRA